MGYQPRMDIDWVRPLDKIVVSEHIWKSREDAQAHVKEIHKAWE